jgi:nicotinate-nucleotide adenylyltransferase
VDTQEKQSLKIAIMGGTFDPVHLGHLKAAEMSRKKLDLQKVIFVTAYCPPHKSADEISPAEDRFAMVELAVKDNPHFESSRIEMAQTCPCYAGDTIKAFQKSYGSAYQIFFITGLDALLTIINWNKAKTYPGLCYFIAAARPGYKKELVEKRIPHDYLPYITLLEEPSLSISSTEIRKRVNNGQSIDEMVPAAVRDYIVTHSLYKQR